MRAAALVRALGLGLALAGGAATAQTCRAAYDRAPPAVNACGDDRRVTLAFVGDVLLHSPLQRQAYAAGFGTLWSAAAPFLREADLAVANLEGPVATGLALSGFRGDPGAVFDGTVHSSYPLFNYHASLLPALRDLGIDAVSTANNHALDRFSAGADATIDALEAAGLPHSGTIRTGAPRDFVLHLPSALGRIALLSCTFSTNGVPDPGRQALNCFADRDEVMAAIRAEAARPGVAGVIVLPHWGVEYTHVPGQAERALAAEMAAAGAMAVIATHPHVVQPVETVPGPSGAVPVAYSTGNFVSGQVGLARQTGMLLRIGICLAAPEGDLALGLGARAAVAELGWVALAMVRGAGRELAVADEGGVAPAARAAHDLVERIVPGRALMPRLVCDGDGPFAAGSADLPALLQ
ncbi:CapA family protein [Wenxinia saemankumensis]|uniref:Poly-gamma-glutamate synthesis protein (Capsule biosynthesis protein) n=1 Tax=Wenxinia saemankumensis TaxID=1447782 RepID=A0A1M6A9M8_9RHOB|nr:CapA family protein [Wenxinia saemankumensis]SHI33162.1 poly-gamma-glutamate synthesis protein (capsule biosynthesis protein) [Wenxinia saemankumensis]